MNGAPDFELRPSPPAPPAAPGAGGSEAPRLTRRAAAFARRVSARHPEHDQLSRWPVAAVALADLIEAALSAPETAAEAPLTTAWRIVAAIAWTHGGLEFRVPSAAPLDRLATEAAVWRAFDGRNAAQLAERYRLDLSTVYKILRRQRDLRRKRLTARRDGQG